MDPVPPPTPRPRWESACLLAILALALGLRLYGLAWGYPADLHCDEVRTLANAASLARHVAAGGLPAADHSNYGNLPYYLLLLVVTPLGALLHALGSALDTGALYLLTGRALSALADTASVYLIYLLGRRLWGARAGLLGAGLYAVTLLAVREAHFATVDPLATFTTLLLIVLAVRAAERPAWGSFLWCGAALGLALSVKMSALLLAPLPLLVWALAAAREEPDRPAEPWPARAALLLVGLAAAAALGRTGQIHHHLTELAQAHLTASAASLAETHNASFWQAQAQAMVTGLTAAVRNAGLLALALAVAGLLWSFRAPGTVSALWRRLGQPLALLGLAVGLFFLLQPTALVHPRSYWLSGAHESVLSDLVIAGGANQALPASYTFQFVGTRPVLYQLQHVYPYAWGWPLLALALLAVAFWAVQLLRRRAGQAWVPAAGLGLLLLSMAASWSKMARYVLPQLPLFCLLAGGMLGALLQARKCWLRGAGLALAALAGLSALLWCGAYLTLYAHPDSRLQALAWVQQRARPGDHILLEEDDTWGAAGEALWQRQPQWEVRVYDPHLLEHDYYGQPLPPQVRAAKERYLAEQFAWANYAVLTGLRQERMRPVARWFPVMYPWYAALFSGQLDLTPAAAFTPQPHLLGWTLSDRGSEPTFRLFDHPDVYIFQRALPDTPATLLRK